MSQLSLPMVRWQHLRNFSNYTADLSGLSLAWLLFGFSMPTATQQQEKPIQQNPLVSHFPRLLTSGCFFINHITHQTGGRVCFTYKEDTFDFTYKEDTFDFTYREDPFGVTYREDLLCYLQGGSAVLCLI